jgi:hypothetical protein
LEEKKQRRKIRKRIKQEQRQEFDQKLKDQTLLKQKKVAEKHLIKEQLEIPSIEVSILNCHNMESYIYFYIQTLNMLAIQSTGTSSLIANTESSNKNNPDITLHKRFLQHMEQKRNTTKSSEDTMEDETLQQSNRILHDSIECHICSNKFKQVHYFYHKLCPDCAQLNYQKRNLIVDLTGKIALVTGGRIKIGYEICLRLLRCNSSVIVTTRFPKDCAMRFAQEHDYEQFKDRLKVYGLDFRHIPSVISFAQFVSQTFPRLDILINNAAQTIRRPPMFYEDIAKKEQLDSVPESIRGIIGYDWVMPVRINASLQNNAVNELSLIGSNNTVSVNSTGISGLMSQLPLVIGDEERNTSVFPKGVYDINNEQLDLRTENSWTLQLQQVPVF